MEECRPVRPHQMDVHGRERDQLVLLFARLSDWLWYCPHSLHGPKCLIEQKGRKIVVCGSLEIEKTTSGHHLTTPRFYLRFLFKVSLSGANIETSTRLGHCYTTVFASLTSSDGFFSAVIAVTEPSAAPPWNPRRRRSAFTQNVPSPTNNSSPGRRLTARKRRQPNELTLTWRAVSPPEG